MTRISVIPLCLTLLLVISTRARPNKKPKQVVPLIECDVRAGKVNLPEFIAKCPVNCRETKQPVYGSGTFASISSICNAAIHSGVITNKGGKVIVSKMAGQSSYKGSFSHGIRSLSLPKWRESFNVSVGKPRKGVLYPSTLDYTPTRQTSVSTELREAEVPSETIVQPTVAEPTTTTPPTTSDGLGVAPSSPLPTVNPHAAVYKVRDDGSSHPYAGGMAATPRAGRTLSLPVQWPAQGMNRQDPQSALRRHTGTSSVPVYNRLQAAAPERGAQAELPSPPFMSREWPPPSYLYPDWYPAPRPPAGTDTGHTGYTWRAPEPSEPAERNPRPNVPEYENWHYGFGPFQPRAGEPDTGRSPLPDTTHTRFKPIDAWKAESDPLNTGFGTPENEPLQNIPEPVSRGDPSCKVDIAFLMDGSWSIGRRRFRMQRDFLSAVSQVINVGVAGPMMGIVQYGDDPVMEIGLKAFPNPQDLTAAIANINQKGGLSNVGKALSYINEHYFTDGNGNRGGAPNVVVVLVDGWPTDRVEEASRLARESGINIFFVTIEAPDDKEKLNVVEADFVDKAVCRTNGFFALPVPSWFDLRSAVRPLVKRVCDTDRLVCSKTCLNANDIAFVIDGSSSVGTGNFRTVLQFVANVTREFEISDTDTRVGAVQYTYEQRLEFAMGQHDAKPALLDAVRAIEYWSGGTSTGAAIAYASQKLFAQSKPNKRKIMIVITDGRSYDDVRAPALALHRSGVIAYSVGIAWAAQEELEYIATDPDTDHSFFVEEFDDLHTFVPKIIHNICQEFNTQPRN
ncbi:vitrin-like isoform X1 [Anguilla rostrata]|uniref:vitrin-like isoform X1 n=1 Tax=Anguilla rostrata TaxID=7938 RepID=UPI0030CAFF45